MDPEAGAGLVDALRQGWQGYRDGPLIRHRKHSGSPLFRDTFRRRDCLLHESLGSHMSNLTQSWFNIYEGKRKVQPWLERQRSAPGNNTERPRQAAGMTTRHPNLEHHHHRHHHHHHPPHHHHHRHHHHHHHHHHQAATSGRVSGQRHQATPPGSNCRSTVARRQHRAPPSAISMRHHHHA